MENEHKILSYGFAESPVLKEVIGQEVFALNAHNVEELIALAEDNHLFLYQPLKAEYDRLKAQDAGYAVYDLAAAYQPESFDKIIICLSKNRPENLFHLGYAMVLLKPGGDLIVYGSNELGAQRYEKDLKNAGMEVDSLHKHKSRIMFAKRPAELDAEILKLWIMQGTTKKIEGTEFETIAGIFSAEKIDKGSQLLIEHLPEKLEGMGADLGCGYGYLGYSLFDKDICKKLASFEHDRRALECARSNLEKFISEENILTFHWQDITIDPVPENTLDWIVMNPPFHQDKTSDVRLGLKFIERAHAGLKKGAALYMVANIHLPYDKPLEKTFSSVERLAEKQGFKIFKAVK